VRRNESQAKIAEEDNKRIEVETQLRELESSLKTLKNKFLKARESIKRSKIRKENKVFKEKLKITPRSLVDRGKDYNENLIKKDSNIENIDIILDLYSCKVSEWSLMTDENRHNEIINIINVLAKKDELLADPNSKEAADWSFTTLDADEVYIPHALLGEQIEQVQNLMLEFEDTILPKNSQIQFGQANVGEEFDIVLKEGAMERLCRKRKKAYNIKADLREIMKITLEEMEKNEVGKLNPQFFYPEIATPSFFVRQKNKWRMVHDYKATINDETCDVIYPLPRIENLIEILSGMTYFSIIDLKSGYYQFKLTERAKAVCVVTPAGIFRFDCLPFGLKNAPAFFQKIMEKVLKDGLHIFVFVYIDDIIIFSKTFSEHLSHLSSVLEMLREANLKASVEKCHLFLKEIKILGRIVSSEGIKCDPALIEAMVNFPIPRKPKDVKRFLALCGYYRHHVKDFGPLTDPLATIAREDFEWKEDTWESNPEYNNTFLRLKNLMCNAPVLAYPDLNKSFYFQTDASLVGAGAVLHQKNDEGKLQVVAYASWLFNSTQRRYHTTERELLALILATRKWKPYLRSSKFFAETDHQALQGCMKLEDPYGKIARWVAELAQFDFSIKYIRGADNDVADALSRAGEELEVDSILHSIVEETYLNLDYSLPSNKEWRDEINKDPDFGPMFEYIVTGRLPSKNESKKGAHQDDEALNILRTSNSYFVDSEGILFHKYKGNSILKCVPRKFRRLILAECRDSIWAGAHFGRDKTLQKILSKYYFKRIRDYVDYYCRTCVSCGNSKPKNHTVDLPLGVIEARYPGDMISIDLWEAGVTSSSGNIYILTAIDGFSKFAYAVPARNKRAETVAEALYTRVLINIGIPNRIHSDLGPEFVNETMKKLCEIFLMRKSGTTTYDPQGNAYAERIHRFFRNALTIFVRRDQRDWDKLINPLIMTYNDTPHDSLNGKSPAEVHLGRSLNTMSIDNNLVDYSKLDKRHHVDGLALAFARIQKEISEKMLKKLEGRKTSLESSPVLYEIGDRIDVLVQSLPAEVKSIKLFPRWKGPYIITKTSHHGKVLYIKDLFDRHMKNPVSYLRVKKHETRELTKFEKLLDSSENEASVQELKNSEFDGTNFSQPFEDDEKYLDPVIDPIPLELQKPENGIVGDVQRNDLNNSTASNLEAVRPTLVIAPKRVENKPPDDGMIILIDPIREKDLLRKELYSRTLRSGITHTREDIHITWL
jgi:hypothetical protein